MRPYSLDLRTKIAQAYDRQHLSHTQLAQTFGVSLSCVEKLLRRRRQTGSLAPAPHGGGHPRLCTPAAQGWLRTYVAAHPDATLQELGAALAAEQGTHLRRTTLWTELRRLGLVRKKRASMPPSRTLRGSSRPGTPSCRR
jgi:transposase